MGKWTTLLGCSISRALVRPANNNVMGQTGSSRCIMVGEVPLAGLLMQGNGAIYRPMDRLAFRTPWVADLDSAGSGV